jgi:hypothetical protein
MVDTDMGLSAREAPEFKALLQQMGAKGQAPEESARLILQQIDGATRETNNFVSHEGKTIPW